MSAPSRVSFWKIVVYFAVLNVVVLLGDPTAGIPNIPLQTLLKDTLHLDATHVATFNFVVSLPLFAGVLFGVVRDRWSPFGLRDRGYFLAFGAIGAATYFALAAARPTYAKLVAGVLALSLSYRFLTTSKEALTARVGKEDGLTGRLSALTNGIGGLLMGFAFIVGGNVEGESRVSRVLAWTGVLTLAFVPLGLWRARGVFEGSVEAPITPAHPMAEARRLLGHRPFRLAVLLWLIIQFTPTLLTPLLFHFTRDLHAGADEYGWFMGLFFLSFVPGSLIYGLVSKRVRFRSMLVWGLVLMVPQMLPILWLHSASMSIVLAPMLALMGVVPTCAVYDLLLRSCPEGLEGSGMMLAATAFWISWKLGDVLGSWIYDHGGIAPTIWVTTAVYASSLLVVPFLPREATA